MVIGVVAWMGRVRHHERFPLLSVVHGAVFCFWWILIPALLRVCGWVLTCCCFICIASACCFCWCVICASALAPRKLLGGAPTGVCCWPADFGQVVGSQ